MAASEAGKRNLRDIAAGVPPGEPATAPITASTPPAGGTGATAGAYDTAANRDLMIAAITANQVDIAAIRQVLVDHGLIA